MFPNNYRLISLLSNENKLFTMILVEKLKLMFQKCIHELSTQENIERQCIQYLGISEKNIMNNMLSIFFLGFLDAYDDLEFFYLIFKGIDYGENCIIWVKLTYTSKIADTYIYIYKWRFD